MVKKLYTEALAILLILNLAACSAGKDNNVEDFSNDKWLVDTNFVTDGGTGKDGIPALSVNNFLPLADVGYIDDADSKRVVGFKNGDDIRVFPHAVMNYHEIFNLSLSDTNYVYSYCPLTGTAAMWVTPPSSVNKKTFGTSGLVFNSNLILYDRETNSRWSQMLRVSINGPQISQIPERRVVVETSWDTWKILYPDSLVLSDDTGWSRDYSRYQYGNYQTTEDLFTEVANEDPRLGRKERVLGVQSSGYNKVYPVNQFDSGIHVINESSPIGDYVVIGSSDLDFAIAFSSVTSDGHNLVFNASSTGLPVVVQDNEGNEWNIFGEAVSGPRNGEKLTLKSEYIAYWFAWVAIFPNPTIYNFD